MKHTKGVQYIYSQGTRFLVYAFGLFGFAQVHLYPTNSKLMVLVSHIIISFCDTNLHVFHYQMKGNM